MQENAVSLSSRNEKHFFLNASDTIVEQWILETYPHAVQTTT